jgi:hypothetical protein
MSKQYYKGESKDQRKNRKAQEKRILEDAEKLKLPDTTNKNIAFVLGNGISREDIAIESLQAIGTVYACNGVYRTHKVDYLIAVDTKMVKEITANGYHLENTVYTNPNRYTRSIARINLFNPNLGWSSGPSALNLASQNGHNQIYILGFDYEGTGPNKKNVNNIFAGTINYKKKDDPATFYGNWTRQTMQCVKKYPKCSYYRIIPEVNSFVPDQLKEINNLTHITKQNFKELFNF